MWKKRLNYLLLAAVFAALLFFFGRPYLVLVLAVMALLAAFLWVFLLHDMGKLTLEAGMQAGSRESRPLQLVLNIRRNGRLWAAGSVVTELEFQYTMYGITRDRTLQLPLTGRSFCYDVPVDTGYCGELCVKCRTVQVYELLSLFCVQAESFRTVRTMIYPRRINLNAELSRDAVGSPKNDGFLQNRKGNDPSEIFDLREYAAGDDIRSIHWKLSGKLDNLVVKEASDPSHYQVVVMPDLGREEMEQEESVKQLNAAVALCAAVGKQLMRQGAAFYMAIPARYGLRMMEVRSSREFQEALSQWMSMELPEKSGLGLQYFMMEHMEQYFSKLLIVSAGRYRQELNSLDGRISITIISAVDRAEFTHVKLNYTCDVVEIPAEEKAQESYRVIC